MLKTGWTGGQYSLVRALLGLYVTIAFALDLAARDAVFSLVVESAAILAGALVLIGLHDRVAALVAAGAAWWLQRRYGGPLSAQPGPIACVLLLAHAATWPSPFGAWSARGRIDPAGRWRLSGLVPWITRVMLLSVAAGAIVSPAGSVAFGLVRPLEWLLLLLFAIDPAWIPGKAKGTVDRVFYDGQCGLCHRAVRFVLAEDTGGALFRLAPLQGATAAETLARFGGLPDSIVLVTADGRALVRSSAILHMMERLGGFWRVIAAALRLVPRFLRDLAYDGIARIRKRLFAMPGDLCPMMPPQLRDRFLP